MVVPDATVGVGLALGDTTGATLGEAAGAPYGFEAPVDAREAERRARVKRGGLGRGLSSLIPGAAEQGGLLEIPVSAVAPNARQPRLEFDEEPLAALARSIREVGVLQPIVVRRRPAVRE